MEFTDDMAELFTADYNFLWTVLLAGALFLPVRHLIWVLFGRRAERDGETDDAERARLKNRAGATAALLCFVFSFMYVSTLMQGRP